MAAGCYVIMFVVQSCPYLITPFARFDYANATGNNEYCRLVLAKNGIPVSVHYAMQCSVSECVCVWTANESNIVNKGGPKSGSE